MDETQVEKTNAIHLGGNLVHGFSMDETQVHGFDANLFQQSKMFGAGRWLLLRLSWGYSLLNPRVSVLATAVKRWAKAHGIAKTYDGTLVADFIGWFGWTWVNYQVLVATFAKFLSYVLSWI